MKTKNSIGRYRMVYAQCDATRPEYWGKLVYESSHADSLLALWDNVGWRGCGLGWEQGIVIEDSRTGKTLSEEEYHVIIKRLKGWD